MDQFEGAVRRQRKPIFKIVPREEYVRHNYTPTAEFTGVRIKGKHPDVRRNFYRTAADHDDGRIPGYIMFRKKRYDGVCIKTNGYLVFHPTEEMS